MDAAYKFQERIDKITFKVSYKAVASKKTSVLINIRNVQIGSKVLEVVEKVFRKDQKLLTQRSNLKRQTC